MAVSKRVRFEVLRRDGFKCHYCGLPAPETGAGLTVDHVLPVALGGTDSPTNLVAACRDCNAGKTSAMPDDGMVPAAVDADTQRLAVEARRAAIRGELERIDEAAFAFNEAWNVWHRGEDESNKIPRPHDWKQSVFDLWALGAPIELFQYAIPIAMERADRKFGEHAEFKYCLGIVRNKMIAHDLDYTISAQTARLYTKYDCEDHGAEEYPRGVEDGRRLEATEALARGNGA